MNTRLEALADCFKMGSRLIRVARAAASALTAALITFFLSGCSVVSDLSNKDIADILISIGQLLGLLPDSVEAKSPMEFIIDKWGEGFGEAFAERLVLITRVPPFNEGPLGDFNRGLTFFSFGLATVFVALYIRKMRSMRRNKYGSLALSEGLTALIPPQVYFQKRFAPVLLVILGGLTILFYSLELMHTVVVGFANAAFESQGQTLGGLAFSTVERLLDGADIWTLAFLVIFIMPVFILVQGLYLWRIGMIELYFVRMMLQIPVYLSGTNYKHLSQPLHQLFKRSVVLGTTWLTMFLGLFVIDVIGFHGFPVALGLLFTLLLVVAAPWILFGFWIIPGIAPSTKLMAEKSVGWFDDFDVYPVDPSVYPEEWDRPSWLRRRWDKMPRVVRGFYGTQAKFATTMVGVHPELAAVREAAGFVREGREVLRGERNLGETAAIRASGLEPPSIRDSGSAPRISSEDLETLVKKAREAGLNFTKNEYDDDILAVVAELVSQGSAATSVAERKSEANRLRKAMTNHEKEYWKRRGFRLRRKL